MRNRRGLSTVVGAVFFIIAMTVTIGYISSSMDTLDQFAQTVIVKSSVKQDRVSEEFEVSKTAIVNNKFNLTVHNTGEIPVKLTRLWIENKTATNWVYKYDLSENIPPGSSKSNIGQNLNLQALSTAGYYITVITERGNSESFSINSSTEQALTIQLNGIPDLVPTGFTTTLLMTVVNDQPSNNLLLNIEPNPMQVTTLLCEDSETCKVTMLSSPDPSSVDILRSGDATTFKWIYRLDGSVTDSWQFTASLKNGVPGNNATTISTIQQIELSNIAGQSISTLGLGFTIFDPEILILHNQGGTLPANTLQMDPTEPTNSIVSTFDDSSDVLNWFSMENFQADMNIYNGTWIVGLRYNSGYLPDGITSSNAHEIYENGQNGGHIWHFNTNVSPILDSSQDSSCYNLTSSGSAGTNGNPVWYQNGGPDSSGAYYFDGVDDYIRVDDYSSFGDGCNDPEGDDFTMAGWFKADIQPSNDARQSLWEKSDGGDSDYYQIAIGDGTSDNHGKVYFRWHNEDSDASGVNGIECESDSGPPTTGYMDGQWHHFVGLRFNISGFDDLSCKLYIDGNLKDTEEVDDILSSDDDVRPNGDVYVGSNRDGDEYYAGYLDQFMFWNYYDLTSSEVTTLYQDANYGPSAHGIDLIVDIVDTDGNFQENIFKLYNYTLPHVDQEHLDDIGDLWKGKDVSIIVPLNYTLSKDTGERLDFTMAYNYSNMDFNLNYDDGSLDGVSEPLSSFLDPSETDIDFLAYAGFKNSDDIVIFIYNQGNVGTWLTYQGTRIVFENGTEYTSYAGLIKSVNSTGVGEDPAHAVTEDQDSLYIGPNQSAEITFWGPQIIPKASVPEPLDRIPIGTWGTNIFISGYTDYGNPFLKTIKIGTILVWD